MDSTFEHLGAFYNLGEDHTFVGAGGIEDGKSAWGRSKITAPFQALSSDITELKFKGGKAYLCVHKDVFEQMIYGWSLGLTMETKLVSDSLEMARLTIRSLIGKIIKKPTQHQDRGSLYYSPYFGQ